METRVRLDVAGLLAGTDKSSATGRHGHDYLRHYEFMFEELREAHFNLIEVGVKDGQSLAMWASYFPNATIIGIDIQERCRAFAGGRVQVEIGSQADTDFIHRICAQHPPTIFIEDGSHLAEHNIVTFEAAFGSVLPGGFYVVEDMHAHFGAGAAKWQTKKICDSPGYFLDIARCKLARRHISGVAVPRPLLRAVDFITFIGAAAILRKTAADYDLAGALALIEAERDGQPMDAGLHTRLAAFILRHDGSVADAVAHLDAAESEEGPSAERSLLRAEAMLAAGNAAGAADALEKAVRENGGNPNLRPRLESMRRQIEGAKSGGAVANT